jgi:hypothetical protein
LCYGSFAHAYRRRKGFAFPPPLGVRARSARFGGVFSAGDPLKKRDFIWIINLVIMFLETYIAYLEYIKFNLY